MLRDLRNLPGPVVERLSAAYGPEFHETRHAGLDIAYRGRILEHRANLGVEVRADADGDATATRIVGYATVYETAYDVAGGPPWGWSETIARGACDKSVREQDDVFLFFDHEGLPLARTRAGTLTLASDQVGLYQEATPDPDSAWSAEIVSRLLRGELDAMSFAFRVIRQEWNEDYTERRILEVQLFDTSVVSYPANPATVVGVRADDPADPVTAAVEAEARSVGMPLGLARAIRDQYAA